MTDTPLLDTSSLLEPLTFAGQELRNRVAMAPMTTWAADTGGQVSSEEIAYFARRGHDVGLVITGCTHVTANGIGFVDEFASYDDRFLPGLTRLAEAAKSGGAKAVLQIFHAGNQGMRDLIPGNDLVSASAVTTSGGAFSKAQTPRALSDAEIRDIVKAFGDAARRAIRAGFDGVELHGAHGFLLQNFLSPYYNRRNDDWGGSDEKRMRFALDVVREVRRVIDAEAGRPFMLGFRISPEESVEGGLRLHHYLPLVDRLIAERVDYLHVSQPGGALKTRPKNDPDGATITKRLTDHVAGRVSVIVAGVLRTSADALGALAEGSDMAALGQAIITDPDWVRHVQAGVAPELAISAESAVENEVPPKLWHMIESMPGWFDVRKAG